MWNYVQHLATYALVAFEPDVGIVDFVVAKDNVNVTDPLDPNTAPPLSLSPGTYQITGTTAPGFAITGWEVIITHGFGSRKEKQAGTKCILELQRDDHVLVRALVTVIAQSGWVQLFNGKDIQGWIAPGNGADKGQWQVDKLGHLVGRGPASYLFSQRDDFADFHLRAEVSADPGSDGGIFFRSGLTPTGRWFPAGYEANIANNPEGQPEALQQTGTLGMTNTVDNAATILQAAPKASIANGAFLTLEVIAQGNHLTVKLDGKTVAQHTDEKRAHQKGRIALQAYTPQTVVRFKKIEIKELPPEEPGWAQLFNGKDLENWTPSDDFGNWTIKNGELIGTGLNSYVSTKRKDFRDFHLRAEVTLGAGDFGDILFRGAPGDDLAFGVTLHGVDDGLTGTLMYLGKPVKFDGTRPKTPPGILIRVEVIAREENVEVKVNGQTAAVARDPVHGDRKRAQPITLMSLNQGTSLRFKKIEIKELRPNAPALPASWRRFQVPGAGFSVALPPNPESMELPTPGGRKVKGYGAEDPPGVGLYLVIGEPLDPATKEEFTRDPNEIFRRLLHDKKATAKAELGEMKRITVSGLQGAEIALRETTMGKHAVIRMFMIRDHIGVLIALGDAPTPTSLARTFLDSVKVEEQPPSAVAPFDAKKAKEHQDAWAKHLGVPVEIENSIGMKLRLIPPGNFDMGASPAEMVDFQSFGTRHKLPEWYFKQLDGMVPQHRVGLTKPCYAGAHEVTMAQFDRFVKETDYQTEAERDGKGGATWIGKKQVQKPEFIWKQPSPAKADSGEPVVHVSYSDVQAFCAWLSKKEGRTYRLPTEAEWEFFCRAGTGSLFHTGSLPPDAMNCDMRVRGPSVVGKYPANAFGLYDVHGNVWEWCSDLYSTTTYASSPAVDPTGPSQGKNRVIRSGGWDTQAIRCASAYRMGAPPTDRDHFLGFRLVLVDLQPPLTPRAQAPFDEFKQLPP